MKLNYIIILVTLFCFNLTSQDLKVTVTTINETCTLGSATVTVAFGTEPYSYNWSNGGDLKINQNLKKGNYTVTVSDFVGKSASANFVIEQEECGVVAANHFTPNGDNYNDTWSIQNLEHFLEFNLTVYNKWGQQVHHQTNNYINWDGTSLGLPLPDGAYYYILFYEKTNKNKFIKGSVSILR